MIQNVFENIHGITLDKLDKNYKQLAKYIHVIEDLVPDTLCNQILEEYKNDSGWTPMAIGGGQVVKDVRNVEGINLSNEYTISVNYEVRKKIDEDLFQCVGKAIQSYSAKFPFCAINNDTGYGLLRYHEGQFYVQHTDSYADNYRTVSCSLALNEEYTGGEFAFFNQRYKYRLKKGSAILFPSNFMYPHQILTVTSGVRYSIITWFQ